MQNVKLFVISVLAFAFAITVQAQGDDVPPNAEPGKCYAKCVIPDQYKTVTEQVLVKEAATRRSVVPAQYETVTERMLVQEEATSLTPIAAVYETVTERVLSKEAGTRLVSVPAVYETVTERVVDKAERTDKRIVPPVYETVTERIKVADATTRWEKGKKDPNCLSADPDDCRVMCLVEVPAQYRTVTKKVIKTPASVKEVPVPATYKTLTKKVLKTPATTRTVEIPAEYKTVTKRVLKTPASVKSATIPAKYRTVTKTIVKTPENVREETIPAEYATVTKTVLVSKGGYTEWREVLCESDLTTDRIRQIQRALKAAGYDPGPFDNIFGSQTRAALTKYQRDNGLPVGRLDKKTLSALGVK
ncbi:MAG: peptidoglycan-binding protein [Bacteroidia bacterium]